MRSSSSPNPKTSASSSDRVGSVAPERCDLLCQGINLGLKRRDEAEQVLAVGHHASAQGQVAEVVHLKRIAAVVGICPVPHGEEHAGLASRFHCPTTVLFS